MNENVQNLAEKTSLYGQSSNKNGSIEVTNDPLEKILVEMDDIKSLSQTIDKDETLNLTEVTHDQLEKILIEMDDKSINNDEKPDLKIEERSQEYDDGVVDLVPSMNKNMQILVEDTSLQGDSSKKTGKTKVTNDCSEEVLIEIGDIKSLSKTINKDENLYLKISKDLLLDDDNSVLNVISSMNKNIKIFDEETPSQGPSSRKIGVTEITNNPLEEISIEMDDIESLSQTILKGENLGLKIYSPDENSSMNSNQNIPLFVSVSCKRKRRLANSRGKVLMMRNILAMENVKTGVTEITNSPSEEVSIEMDDIKSLSQTILKSENLGLKIYSPNEMSSMNNNKKIPLFVSLSLKGKKRLADRRGKVFSAIQNVDSSMNDCFEILTNSYERKLIWKKPENPWYSWALKWANCNLTGSRFELLEKVLIHMCYLEASTTALCNYLCFMPSKKFENLLLHLNNVNISTGSPTRMSNLPIYYQDICNVHRDFNTGPGEDYILKIEVDGGAYVLRTNTLYLRDQLYHSILWRKEILRYRSFLRGSTDMVTILDELMSFIRFLKLTPIQGDEKRKVPIEIISKLFHEIDGKLSGLDREQELRERLIVTIYPLLEHYQPSLEMCEFFSAYFCKYPLSFSVQNMIYESIRYILIHHLDDVKYPFLRKFLQAYIDVLSYQDDANEAFKSFLARIHGTNSICSHPKVLSNLASNCIIAIEQWVKDSNERDENLKKEDQELEASGRSYQCSLNVLQLMFDYSDWLPELTTIIEPDSFDVRSLNCEHFVRNMAYILEKVVADSRCEVHSQILKSKENVGGWFDIYSPTNGICQDDGRLWSIMVDQLLECGKKRESLIFKLYRNQLDACLSLALKENLACQKALCLMLERNIAKEAGRQSQIIAALKATNSGQIQYTEMCDRLPSIDKIRLRMIVPLRTVLSDLLIATNSRIRANLLNVVRFRNTHKREDLPGTFS